MLKWSSQGEVIAVVAFVVALIMVFSQVFRATPNTALVCVGVLLAIFAMIGFSDLNARAGR